jgi:hypothetical protein
MDIIKIFSDKASGRKVKGRDSFLELLEWVEEKDFQKILVRDVTRWGRFDDIDESAYWVKCEGAFIPIVSKEDFSEAKQIRGERRKTYTDGELLTMLHDLYAKFGILSPALLIRCGLPRAETYRKRFDSLEGALLLSQKGIVQEATETTLNALKKAYRVRELSGSYLLEEKIRLGINVSFLFLKRQVACWIFQIRNRGDDFTLGLGLGKDRSPRVWKHFLFPNLVMEGETVHIPVEASGFYQMYECNNLNLF